MCKFGSVRVVSFPLAGLFLYGTFRLAQLHHTHTHSKPPRRSRQSNSTIRRRLLGERTSKDLEKERGLGAEQEPSKGLREQTTNDFVLRLPPVILANSFIPLPTSATPFPHARLLS